MLSTLEGKEPVMNMTKHDGTKNKSQSTYVVALDPAMGTGGDRPIQVFELPKF